MPDPKSGAAGGGADFVKNIVKDPANVPDVTQYAGWVGDSSEPDHTRLYLKADLSSYLEIPDADRHLDQMQRTGRETAVGRHQAVSASAISSAPSSTRSPTA